MTDTKKPRYKNRKSYRKPLPATVQIRIMPHSHHNYVVTKYIPRQYRTNKSIQNKYIKDWIKRNIKNVEDWGYET